MIHCRAVFSHCFAPAPGTDPRPPAPHPHGWKPTRPPVGMGGQSHPREGCCRGVWVLNLRAGFGHQQDKRFDTVRPPTHQLIPSPENTRCIHGRELSLGGSGWGERPPPFQRHSSSQAWRGRLVSSPCTTSSISPGAGQVVEEQTEPPGQPRCRWCAGDGAAPSPCGQDSSPAIYQGSVLLRNGAGNQ